MCNNTQMKIVPNKIWHGGQVCVCVCVRVFVHANWLKEGVTMGVAY